MPLYNYIYSHSVLFNLLTHHHIHIAKATNHDFDFIKEHIQRFDLDNRNLEYQQFVIAKMDDALCGFVRIRKHNGCDEFCSLGILEAYRQQGIAEALILNLIKLSTQSIYLVCIIPHFFESLGFSIVTVYPPEIVDKLNYCTSNLVVEEPYVVMTYKNEGFVR